MNVYEEAHRLEQAIKESEEYKQLYNLQAVVDQNPELAEKLKEIQQKQIQIQAKQMSGDDVAADMVQAAQEMQQIMLSEPIAAQYMQCAMRFSLMISDVYKILGEAINIGNTPNV